MSFNIKGVRVTVTFMFAAILTLFLSLRVPYTVLIAVISSILHETGHLAMMAAVGNPPESVRLELGGMNIKRMQSVRISPRDEIFIALSGPSVNALIFAVCTVLYCFSGSETLLGCACVNLVLMSFNLLPVKGLDGGMVLYFLLSNRRDADFARKILKITSFFCIFLIFLWGIYVFACSGYNFSVLIIGILLTISMFGNSEY